MALSLRERLLGRTAAAEQPDDPAAAFAPTEPGRPLPPVVPVVPPLSAPATPGGSSGHGHTNGSGKSHLDGGEGSGAAGPGASTPVNLAGIGNAPRATPAGANVLSGGGPGSGAAGAQTPTSPRPGASASFVTSRPTGSAVSGSLAASALPKLGQYARQIEADAVTSVDQIKVDLHRRLVERLDLTALERIKDETVLLAQIRQAVLEFLRAEQAPLSATERDDIVEQIVYEVTGLGPIEPLFRDPTISDILVNGPKDVYVERRGRLSKTNILFRDDAHLLSVIDRIVSRVGRRVDESSPMVDARLPDGSRVNAIIPPLALNGPVLSIRRFGTGLTAQQLVEKGALVDEMLYLLAGCVHARLNILVSGGTGSGKTTMLNALSSFVQNEHRVVTIEDAAELRLQQEHVVRLETRPPNTESRGEVSARDLVKNALRMRPDRIILGEVRGAEALDMLQAMNTGHEGSLGTIHANTAREALSRLETMILYAGTTLPVKAMRDQISSAIDVIVQVSRLADGSRRVMSITELTGMEGDVITIQEIYRFARQGVSPDGTVLGRFEPTGVRPQFYERLRVAGVELPPDMFMPR